MIKASDLLKNRDLEQDENAKVYEIEYLKCVHFIKEKHKSSESIYYELPFFSPNTPTYDVKECLQYIKNKLRDCEFYCKIKNDSTLYISWKREHVLLMQKILQDKELEQLRLQEEIMRKEQQELEEMENELKRERQLQLQQKEAERQERLLNYKPNTALSDLYLKTSLMKKNSKYSHLKGVKKANLKNSDK